MDRWFEGVYLLGRVAWVETGCWLLVNGDEAAVLELPPSVWGGPDPVRLADPGRRRPRGGGPLPALLARPPGPLQPAHPAADARPRSRGPSPCSRPASAAVVGDPTGMRFFHDCQALALGDEPLHLVHAPKHSSTDTMVVFRGAACTGDWELGTVRTVHDWNPIARVPVETRVRSCERMMAFPRRANYAVHRVFSVHGTDRRENVDFPALMAATREDRQLW